MIKRIVGAGFLVIVGVLILVIGVCLGIFHAGGLR